MAANVALLQVGTLFAVAALVGVVANRLGQSVIPFYIVAGLVIGESVLGRAVERLDAELPGIALEYAFHEHAMAFVELGAELGIVFLLFFLGLEFNLERLFENRNRIGKAGTYDLAINFGVGLVLGYAMFGAFLPAFLVAGIVYISSSAIITKSLIDLGWIANDEANPMLGTLVYEDLVIAVYLVVATALVLGGGSLEEAAQPAALALGFIAALVLFVHYGSGFFERALETDSHEHFVLRAVGITVLIAGAALALGVSEAVAAFFVGMGFSATDHTHQLERLLEPLRDVFAAVFFFWIGIVTDPLLFGGVIGFVAAAVVVTTPTKLLSGYLGGRIYDLDERRSLRVALGMTTRGEFSLIIASVAIAGGSGVGDTINAFAVGYVLVMSVLGTTLMQYSDAIESAVVPRLEARRASPQPGDD